MGNEDLFWNKVNLLSEISRGLLHFPKVKLLTWSGIKTAVIHDKSKKEVVILTLTL